MNPEPELATLESQMEQTRERLASTIDEIVDRAAPKNILNRQVAATKAHFIDPVDGSPRVDNILKVAGAVVGVIVVLRVIRRVTC